MPPAIDYIVQWFYSIRRIGNLTYSELNAWAQLNGLTLQPFELELLIELEANYNEEING